MMSVIAGVVGVGAGLGVAAARRAGRPLLAGVLIAAQLAVLAAVLVVQDGRFGVAGVVGVAAFTLAYVVSDVRTRGSASRVAHEPPQV
ncbi:hypothetical protein ACTVCO_04490 [Sanguibacter sp. A247]|uniref:hypothetical protein n=1 Tax=unclassified Sanguibacter TaxID=2645534 RepID=UPI003FD7D299